MKITLFTTGSRGDVQPYIGLGVGLRRAGHQVRMPAPELFRELIMEAGLEFIPVAGIDPQAFIRSPEVQALVGKAESPLALLRLFQIVQRHLATLFDDYWATSADSDLLISSTITFFGTLDCAEKRGVPWVFAPQQPLEPTRAFPNAFLAPWGLRLNHPLNRLTYHLLSLALWQFFSGPLGRWRRAQGLPRRSYHSYRQQMQASLTVHGFSPSVLPVPGDWPPRHHVSGYWFLDAPPGWQPPGSLLRFLEAGAPPVYVGFGSMAEQDPTRMTSVVVEALKLSGLRGVLLSGWAGLGHIPLPDTIYRLESIPHSWLFPHMAAVVHHGGMGTTAAGLRAGKPTIIIPVGGDQPFWAERVKQLGVGARCASYTRVTARQLAAALQTCLADSALGQRASTLGAAIRAEDGVNRAAQLITEYSI